MRTKSDFLLSSTRLEHIGTEYRMLLSRTC